MLFDGAPTVVGHRGYGAGMVGGHAENTLGSFLAAVEAGADWVEVDVRRTFDALLPAAEATVGLLAPVAQRESARRPVAVVSFDPAALLAMRHLAPDVATGWLTWLRFPVGFAVSAVAHLDVQFLGLQVGSLVPNRPERVVQVPPVADVVRHVHGAGREMLVWAPSGDALRMVADAGVDAVCVDDVHAALVTLGRAAAAGPDEHDPAATGTGGPGQA